MFLHSKAKEAEEEVSTQSENKHFGNLLERILLEINFCINVVATISDGLCHFHFISNQHALIDIQSWYNHTGYCSIDSPNNGCMSSVLHTRLQTN